jgi:hypothetical protein
VANPSTPPVASAPIPPPVGNLQFVDSNGMLTPTGWEFLQLLWASIQGDGGIIDQFLLLPPPPVLASLLPAIHDAELRAFQPAANLAFANPPQVVALEASETIAAYGLVNVWSNSGAFNIRNANGSVGIASLQDAHGFINTGVTSGQFVQVHFSGLLNGLSALTPGPAYLAGTAGGVTSTPLTTPGDVSQQVGIAVSATSIWFAPQTPVGL